MKKLVGWNFWIFNFEWYPQINQSCLVIDILSSGTKVRHQMSAINLPMCHMQLGGDEVEGGEGVSCRWRSLRFASLNV